MPTTRTAEVSTVTTLAVPQHFTGDVALKWQREAQAVVQAEQGPFVFDFGHTESVASEGLSALVSLARQCQRGGQELVLAGLKPAVKETFLACGLQYAFQSYPGTSEAQKALQNPLPRGWPSRRRQNLDEVCL